MCERSPPVVLTLTASNQFVNRATGSDAFLVGNGLHSCTSEIQFSPTFVVDGRSIVLIDTPGFNDTVMEDADVLKDISAFLATVCVISPPRCIQLSGVSGTRVMLSSLGSSTSTGYRMNGGGGPIPVALGG